AGVRRRRHRRGDHLLPEHRRPDRQGRLRPPDRPPGAAARRRRHRRPTRARTSPRRGPGDLPDRADRRGPRPEAALARGAVGLLHGGRPGSTLPARPGRRVQWI
ncbi:MAG: hypothetical protein AVDCRST_MAG59-875, partial [uncultured Thermomicrobiales bacterium]